jgi:alkylhydroperoxidase/carboxymuconolactone decarboxylase family protein YurZ
MSAVLDELSVSHSAVADRFLALRQAIAAGPLSVRERELVIVAGMNVARYEKGFRVHLHRAVLAGATAEEIEHVVLISLGAQLGLAAVVETLAWAREEFKNEPARSKLAAKAA